MDVTGVVGEPFDSSLDHPIASPAADWRSQPLTHVTALWLTLEQHARARAAKRPAAARFARLPWHELCRETGEPVAGQEVYGGQLGEQHPVCDAALARGQARDDREQVAQLLGLPSPGSRVIVDDLTDHGWVGVMHADGNNVGGIFHDFPALAAHAEGVAALTLDQHVRHLQAFSHSLAATTEQAFTAAVEAVRASHGLDDERVWRSILPIVVGGDDVTVICHASLAQDLTEEYLTRFQELTSRSAPIRAIVDAYRGATGHQAATGPVGLTASAGIAFVQRHHPFAYAAQLAEDLAVEAKSVLRRDDTSGTEIGSYDLHVLRESTMADLNVIRRERISDGPRPFARYAGPFVLMPDAGSDHRCLRSAHQLRRLLALIGTHLSTARAHILRDASGQGEATYERALSMVGSQLEREQAIGRGTDDRAAQLELMNLLTIQEDGATRFLLLPDALLLQGILHASGTQTRDDSEGAPAA